jgi:hypothetical protein
MQPRMERHHALDGLVDRICVFQGSVAALDIGISERDFGIHMTDSILMVSSADARQTVSRYMIRRRR